MPAQSLADAGVIGCCGKRSINSCHPLERSVDMFDRFLPKNGSNQLRPNIKETSRFSASPIQWRQDAVNESSLNNIGVINSPMKILGTVEKKIYIDTYIHPDK